MKKEKSKDELARMPDAEFADWLETASDKELRAVNLDLGDHLLSGTKGWLVQQELEIRTAKRHHWTLTPVFFIAFLTMIFAAIAAWPTIRDWISSSPNLKKDVGSGVVPVPRNAATPSPPVASPFNSSPTP